MHGIPESLTFESAQNAIVLIGIGTGVRIIQITKGLITIVDEEDYEKLMQHSWFVHKSHHCCYAARLKHGNKKDRIIQMHREILCLSYHDGNIVDHINRDGLDNRKCNLRIVFPSLNRYNSRMMSINTSGYRGVSWHKQDRRWRANIGVKGKQIWCGQFTDRISAALAYDKAAIRYYGNDAVLNFPNERI